MKIGETIKRRYKIEDLLPSGGQADVAVAIDKRTRNKVVLKKLINSGCDRALARFQREADIRLNHPNVIDPIENFKNKDNWYIAYPYIHGSDLSAHVLNEGGTLPANEAVRIVLMVADGLGAGHSRRIIHRDVKPENILIGRKGSAHLIDFGLASLLDGQTISDGKGFQGSLFWASPEQVLQTGTDVRTDIYSLGAVLYFLLLGEDPTEGNTPEEIMISICRHTPQSPRNLNNSIPQQIDRVCMTMLQKRPDDRFQSMTEVVQALNGPEKIEHTLPSNGKLFCGNCKTSIGQISRFCPSCGTSTAKHPASNTFCMGCGHYVCNRDECRGCNRKFSPVGNCLIFTEGTLRGATFLLPEGIYTTGRTVLGASQKGISRQHFSIACFGGDVAVQDGGSRNGTLVEGKPVKDTVVLRPGNEIQIADHSCIYSTN